uniref:Tripartite motif containing 59 n=1 Tax=Petromyzon marinus TaxID=7757 RepID=S4RGW7_PETMA
MEHLEEDLTCPVCFSLFEEPRVLPCSHTFCRRCLESVLQATVEQFPLWRALRVPLKCPSCRHMFDMPSAGLSYLPLNYSLVAIVEKYRRQQKLQRERELAESARPPACAEHSEQPLNVYCLTDRTLVCGFCLTLGEHRSHDIESLASACAREGRVLEESTRALLNVTRGPGPRREPQLLELEAQRAGYEVLVNQEAAQVEAYFAALRDDLGKQQMAVMEYMEAASRHASLGYERAIGVLRGVLDEHAAVLTLAGEAQDAMLLGEPVAFLQKMHVFRERYELLRAAACAARPEPPSFGPRCQDYLVRGWADVPLGRLGDAPLPR